MKKARITCDLHTQIANNNTYANSCIVLAGCQPNVPVEYNGTHQKFWLSRYFVRSTFVLGSWTSTLDLSGTVITSISLRPTSTEMRNTCNQHNTFSMQKVCIVIPFLFSGLFLTHTVILLQYTCITTSNIITHRIIQQNIN